MKLSKPELVALLLYAPGQTNKIGEEVVGRTRLMKIIFLLLEEGGLSDEISKKATFKPYKYGPFDAEFYDAIEALKELKVIEETPVSEDELEISDIDEPYDVNTVYKLTPVGIAKVQRIVDELSPDVIRKITNYKSIYTNKPLVEILHYVYSKYPEYATVSEAKV